MRVTVLFIRKAGAAREIYAPKSRVGTETFIDLLTARADDKADPVVVAQGFAINDCSIELDPHELERVGDSRYLDDGHVIFVVKLIDEESLFVDVPARDTTRAPWEYLMSIMPKADLPPHMYTRADRILLAARELLER